jgi:MscS family membrane protein
MSWESITSYETLKNLGISIGIFLLFIFFRKIFIRDIFDIIIKLSKKTPTDLLYYVCLAFEHPARWLFVIIGLYLALGFFPFINQSNPLILKLMRASIIALISWGLINLSSASSHIFNKLNQRFDLKIDQILIPFLSKALQAIIIAISISVIAQEFNYDVNGFVAGLGIGGLAFALAAKDALANLFGGIVIITEKPFSIGDWIMTPSVDGTVEDITFRSTKVRTSAQAIVTVPNATLANQAITNWSKMGKRQVSFRLGVTFDTPKNKLERIVQRIDGLLRSH